MSGITNTGNVALGLALEFSRGAQIDEQNLRIMSNKLKLKNDGMEILSDIKFDLDKLEKYKDLGNKKYFDQLMAHVFKNGDSTDPDIIQARMDLQPIVDRIGEEDFNQWLVSGQDQGVFNNMIRDKILTPMNESLSIIGSPPIPESSFMIEVVENGEPPKMKIVLDNILKEIGKVMDQVAASGGIGVEDQVIIKAVADNAGLKWGTASSLIDKDTQARRDIR